MAVLAAIVSRRERRIFQYAQREIWREDPMRRSQDDYSAAYFTLKLTLTLSAS